MCDMEKELSSFFENKFETVNYKFYGAMHKRVNQCLDLSVLSSLSNAYISNSLRTFFGLKKERLYYCCRNKL